MKDLTFSGGALTTPVTFRVDSISGGGNMSVLETYGLDDRRVQTIDTQAEVALLTNFKKINYSYQDFVAHAVTNNLTLIQADSNGENEVQLGCSLTVIAPAQDLETADTTPAFSGTGTPGGLVTVTIGGDDVTATVAAAGTWSVNWSPALAVALYTATVTLTKGGVSATPVERDFEVTV